MVQNDPIRDELADYFERMKNGRPAAVGLEDALRVQQILKAAAASDASGRVEGIRPDD